jgi:S-adenosylmethionine synthetase
MAKNLVAAGVADEILVQLSYAIGVVEPTSININTFGTAKVDLSDEAIASIAETLFDMRPYAIEQRLQLRNPMYFETASYGHMGRKPLTITKTFESPYNGKVVKEVALFTWEKLDYVETIKKSFSLS